ncbi:hypothetical protein DSO57_1016707, partial [Entomophthora muscae]
MLSQPRKSHSIPQKAKRNDPVINRKPEPKLEGTGVPNPPTMNFGIGHWAIVNSKMPLLYGTFQQLRPDLLELLDLLEVNPAASTKGLVPLKMLF